MMSTTTLLPQASTTLIASFTASPGAHLQGGDRNRHEDSHWVSTRSPERTQTGALCGVPGAQSLANTMNNKGPDGVSQWQLRRSGFLSYMTTSSAATKKHANSDQVKISWALMGLAGMHVRRAHMCSLPCRSATISKETAKDHMHLLTGPLITLSAMGGVGLQQVCATETHHNVSQTTTHLEMQPCQKTWFKWAATWRAPTWPKASCMQS